MSGADGDRSHTSGPTDYRTERFAGLSGVALLFVLAGVALRSEALVLASLVAAGLAGYARLASPPALRRPDGSTALTLDRSLDDPSPDPGDEVEVTVELRNEGANLLPDVRVVDGVPPEIEVTDGSPRHAALLRAGESTAFSYTVTARRGDHDWGPARVVVADPGGSVEREVDVVDDTTLYCSLPLLSVEDLPLRSLTSPYAGRVETDSGGSGVEFYSTREFQPNDPLNRIDWYRRARTGELGTLEFREERAATVMLVLDTRRVAYRAPEPGEHHAVERSVEAAGRAFSALLDTGDRVGVTAFGRSQEDCWLSPASGDEHRARGKQLLTEHESFSSIPPDGSLYETFAEERREELKEQRIDRLHARLAPDTQVFLFSPCCDDYVPEVARRLDAYGHLVTVVSPDPTTDDTPLHELAGIERADRLRSLRRSDLRVVDWRPDESFVAALARAESRWSA